MKIVISPAKTLDYKTPLPTKRATQPLFLDTTEKINNKLSKISKAQLSDLMGISDKLTDLNYHRYREFKNEHSTDNSRPAMYAFAGDVYMGLDAYSLPVEKIDRMQDTLRILSGMYGILRPLDLIQPYRLEMGTALAVGRKKDLYGIWLDKLTSYLNKELEKDEIFLNLASKEYFKAIDNKKLKVPVVTPVFKDFRNGKLQFVSIFGKKARGAMVRFIIDNDVKTIEHLKAFDTDGYRYSEQKSQNKNELVFTR